LRVLVTGHEGYIGAVATPVLVAAGHDVVGVDARLYEGGEFGHSPRERVTGFRMDVRDFDAELLRGFDAVVHLAALSNDPVGNLDPTLTLEINHHATVRLAEQARLAGVERFVFSSSCSMYGASGNGVALDETAPLDPLTPYAESKVLAEQSLAPLADEEFAPVYLRNATAYGVSPCLRVDLVLNNLVAWAFTTGEVRLLSDGTAWRPLVHVEDIARAVVAVLEAPLETIRDQAFNVGQDVENYRVRTLAEAVSAAVPRSVVTFAEGGGADPRSYQVDFGKFSRTFPDVRMRWTAHSGAAELHRAFAANGFTRGDIDGPRYVRLRRIAALLEAGALDERLRWASARD
jgi:nucleoside-diphosphate-sugar epimerase